MCFVRYGKLSVFKLDIKFLSNVPDHLEVIIYLYKFTCPNLGHFWN